MNGGHMKPSRKTALFVCALALGRALTVALVCAASPEEDFEWLSVSVGSAFVGASGS